MINLTNKFPEQNAAVKAVGLISGGLDSTLAAKIIKDLGIDVYGVYFAMPWGCCDKAHAMEAAQKIGIRFITLQLDERYLKIIKNPKFGYGRALNPCVDCRIHMFSRAAQYMRHIGAEFVFTGEVLGQRLKSQLMRSMKNIEKGAGLEGRLLRPLSAQLLEPTIPEEKGIIDRSRLLRFSGRSRKDQYRLADELQITEFSAPAGGCLLTDKNFANRMQDTLDHGYRNFRETIALKWGRHYRIDENYKIILGRDKEENTALMRYAHREDIIMQLIDNLGPTCILKGDHPPGDILSLAAGFIQKYSRYKNDPPKKIKYWQAHNKLDSKFITANVPKDQAVESLHI